MWTDFWHKTNDSRYTAFAKKKNDTLIYNDTEKADEFNNFFVLQTVFDESNNSFPDPVQSHHSLNNITITVSDVDDVLKLLNISKASGPDLINPRLLKAGVTELKALLCKLFNLSLSQSVFLADWKQANVTPVFENRNAKEVENYRPISLCLSVWNVAFISMFIIIYCKMEVLLPTNLDLHLAILQ